MGENFSSECTCRCHPRYCPLQSAAWWRDYVRLMPIVAFVIVLAWLAS